jgi:tyrosyl-tRNA synthetase
VADNAEWLGAMGAIDLLRDVGKHFSVNVMLAKESVRGRMETGISFTEFSYMLLQSYDFVELRRRLRRHGAGGRQRPVGEHHRRHGARAAHGRRARARPDVPPADHELGAEVRQDRGGRGLARPERTSPYQFFQFWMHAADRDVGRLLRFYTLMPRDEIEALDRATAERPARREAQHALAYDVTGRVHGAEAARVAQQLSALLFAKGDPHGLSPAAVGALSKEMPVAEVARPAEGIPALDAVELFVAAGLAPSKGAARRLLEQGGLTVSGRRLTAASARSPTRTCSPAATCCCARARASTGWCASPAERRGARPRTPARSRCSG